jgi:hypothetical protein
MWNSGPMKAAMVWGILLAAWLGHAGRASHVESTAVWISAIAAFGIFNAVVSAPGTGWIRGIAVLGTMATLVFGRVELYALGAWIAWPPAFMVSWALGQELERRADPEIPAGEREMFTPARINLAALMIALTIAAVAYRLIFARGLHQSSALFVGIPALIAVIVVFTVSPKSAAGVACKAVTIGLLMSLLFLGEGVLCVIMAAPLFYAVAIGIASSVQWITMDNDKRLTLRSCLILVVVLPMSIEGVTDSTSFNRQEKVSVTRIVDRSVDDVAHAVLDYPRFDRPLPLFLRGGFPTPMAANIDSSSARPRWIITFRGGETGVDGVEPRVGTLVLELIQSGRGFARWRAISDTSHMTHYLGWREMSLHWGPSGQNQTSVTCSISYSRDLDPAWYFGPWERYAMRLAAAYLIDTVATP